jgi:phosphatidylinositol 4-kinase type 2
MSKRFLNAIKVVCGRTGDEDDAYDVDEERVLYDASENSTSRGFQWTEELQKSFREELEK